MGRRPYADPHAQLALGARQRRSLYAPAYGYETQIVCMLADSEISAEDYAKVTFETHCVAIDGYTYHDARRVMSCR